MCWKKEVLRAYTNPSASFSGKQAFMLVESIECLYTKKSETQEICLIFHLKQIEINVMTAIRSVLPLHDVIRAEQEGKDAGAGY